MKILFFSPYASRNGAEMMLQHVVNGDDHGDMDFYFFWGKSGPLVDSVKRPNYVSKVHAGFPYNAINKLLNLSSYSLVEWEIRRYHKRVKPDIWYINSIHLPEVSRIAEKLKVPTAVHYHDLLFQYEKVGYYDLKQMIDYASLSIGCSQQVCDNLKVLGAKNIALQYECVDTSFILPSVESIQKIKADLQIPEDAYVWGMSGSINIRKGADYFVSLGQYFKDENVHLIWLGEYNTGYKYFLEKWMVQDNISNVHFVGSKTDDYYDYLSVVDAFVLTSREDPFPLVMIEAASMGKPVVAFPSGGVDEFIKEGMGHITSSFSVEDLVRSMRDLMQGKMNIDLDKIRSRASQFEAAEQASLWRKMIKTNVFL